MEVSKALFFLKKVDSKFGGLGVGGWIWGKLGRNECDQNSLYKILKELEFFKNDLYPKSLVNILTRKKF